MPTVAGTPPTTTLDTDRGPVEYVDQGDGPPVLVIHGSPGGADAGWLMGQFLVAAGFRVVAPSRPGYLGTPLTEASGPIDAQADLHAALLHELGIARAAVLCWSGGGPSSYRLAVRHPESVSGMAAVAAVSRRYEWRLGLDERFTFGTRPGNWLIGMLARHRPEQLISETLSAEGDLDPEELQKVAAAVSADPVQREFVLRLALTVSHRGDRRAGVTNDMTTFAAIDSLQLEAVQAPVLLVQGTADTDVPPLYSEFASQHLPRSTVLDVPGGTHLAAWASPGAPAVQIQIASFLRSA